MIGDIDLSRTDVPKPYLQLAKPNREIIANLTEAYNIKQNIKLGSINTLEFCLPYDKDVRHKFKRNQNVDLLKNRYLIKFTKGNHTEWYIIVNPQDTMQEDADYKLVTCYSLGYELADKIIRSYSVVSYNATQVLTDLLSSTLWSVGSIDANFNTMYRSFNISSKTVSDAIIEVATTFNALIDYDTINRKINFYVPDNYGTNQYFTVSYGKLLRTASMQQSTDEFCTRLKVFGKNGISIQGVNPSASNYIEDYSFFLYPFSRDVNKNVLTHSDYMSDSLCNALLDYQALVESKTGQYKNLLSQLSTLQQTLTTQQNALTDLQNTMATIEDNLSVANANGQDTSSLVAQKNSQQTLINNQNALIAATNSQIANVNSQIATLQNQLSVTSNFSTEQIQEWNQFIIEKEYVNDNVDDDQQLYDLAVDYFKTINQPKIVVKIGIVNFWECVEEQQNWSRISGVGDIITIKHEKLGINVQAKITEIDYDYETPDITLTISNVTELLTDEARFLKNLYNSISTSTSVNMNQYKWDQAYSDTNDINQILNNVWDATKREILASNNETVEISRKGIIDRDLNDPNKYVVIQHGQIALTQDGGNTWKTAIKPDGIYAPQLIGQILAGVNLTITNSAGNFLVNQNGLTVSDLTMTVTRSDKLSRILIDPTNGLKIQKNTGTVSNPTWVDQFSADSSGNGVFTGNLSIGSGNSIFLANTSGISLGSSSWSSAPFRVDLLGNAYAHTMTLDTPSISYGSIIGTSINVNNKFIVDSNGNMTATSGTFTGNITGSFIYGTTISGGSITSNTSINVNTNLYVGDKIYLTQGSSGSQAIVFPGGASIDFSGGLMRLSAYSQVDVSVGYFTYNGSEVATKAYVDAQIAAHSFTPPPPG
jgi:phage minor structural protein